MYVRGGEKRKWGFADLSTALASEGGGGMLVVRARRFEINEAVPSL